MKSSFFASVLFSVILLSLFIVVARIAACGLPVDPDVAIILDGRHSYDAGNKTFIVDEDTQVTWKAFWDPGPLGGAAAALGFSGYNFEGTMLFELETYVQVVGTGKLKVSEISPSYPGSPDAISNIGGPIKDCSWTKTWISGGPGQSKFWPDPAAPGDLGTSGSASDSPNTIYTWHVENTGWRGGGSGGRWRLNSGAGGYSIDWKMDTENLVWVGQKTAGNPGLTVSGQVEVPWTYPTPTGNQPRIHLEADLRFEFIYEPCGAFWQWDEVLRDSGGDEKGRRTFAIMWKGTFSHAPETAQPYREAYVQVRDLTPPQHYRADDFGQVFDVGTKPSGSVSVRVLENNPFTLEEGTPSGSMYYSTQLCDWVGFKTDRALCDDTHPHHKYCDCWAFHKEKWVWQQGADLNFSGVGLVFYNGAPAYAVIEFEADMGSMDPVPWHYADGSHGYAYRDGSGAYEAYTDDRLKFFITATDGGGRAAVSGSPPLNSENAQARAPASESGGMVAVPGCDTIAMEDKVKPLAGTLLGAIGAGGEPWTKWGNYGTFGVRDNAPPDVRVYITDTKYHRTFWWGNLDAIDGTVTGYDQARSGGSGSATNAESPYQSGIPAPGPWIFNANGGDDGYGVQLDLIDSGAFGPAYTITEGLPTGFWCDEDTRLLFYVECRDNINPWENPLPFSAVISDGPAGGGGPSWSDDSVIEYTFRDPNKGANAIDAPCTVTVNTQDARGNSTQVVINIFVASNELRMQTLEEQRKRLSEEE